MSVARGFGINGKSYYTNVSKPSEIHVQFKVDSADSAGLGITSLKSNGYVKNVFMNTSATVAGLAAGSPLPAAGICQIQLNNNLNHFLSSCAMMISKPSGSDVKIDNSALTAGVPYIITTLGNATAAKWLAIGVPAGVTPAVGVSFIALTNGGAGNTLTSRVQVATASGVAGVELIGNPDLMTNSNVASNGGEYLILQFLASADGTRAAPADGSIVCLRLLFDGSSVTVDGL